MAKKILAVVLAVMMAVSAMAITAFAEDIEIKMYTQTYDPDGNYFGNYVNDGANVVTHTVTFNIPVYALYGYMTSDYYLKFNLPNNTLAGSKVNWSIIVGGQEYALAAGDGASTAAIENRVYFGILGHPYTETGKAEDGTLQIYWATVPQSMTYGDITSMKLVATFKGDYKDAPLRSTEYYVQAYTNPNDGTDGEPVNQSISFMRDWGGVETNETNFNAATYKFATADWDYTWMLEPNYTGVTTLISFDHTLGNRQSIINLAQNGAKLVVELDNALNGQATYSLWAKKPSSNVGSNWWQYKSNRTYVGAVSIDGAKSSLEFDVPYSVLYDANYGVLVEQFVIFENITLMNNTVMKNYLRFESDGWAANGYDTAAGKFTYAEWARKDVNDPYTPQDWVNATAPIKLGVQGSGDLGRLGWRWSDRVCYDGNQVRYADGGVTSEYVNTDEGDLAPARATVIKLVIPVADEDNTEVNQPAEGTGNDEEGEQVEDNTPEVTVPADDEAPATGNDANPGTGIALAVVPMLVAAAAAVVSKKH